MGRLASLLIRWAMPAFPRRVSVEALELFWADGFRTGALVLSAFWLTIAVVYVLFRKPRP